MFTIKQVKKIIKEEVSTHDVDIIIVNKLEYYRSDFFKSNIKIKRIKEKIQYIKYPFMYSGLYSEESNLIIIFITNCKAPLSINIKHKFTSRDIINTLRILYHEIKHLKQSNLKYNQPMTPVEFIYEMEDIITNCNPKYYDLKHDEFFIEIEANVYASYELNEFATKNNIVDKELLNFIASLQNKYKNRLNKYDFYKQFSEFIKCCKKYGLYKNENNKIIKMIYDNEGNFKSLNEIILDEEFKKLDIRIKTLVIGSLIKTGYLNIEKCPKINIIADNHGNSLAKKLSKY